MNVEKQALLPLEVAAFVLPLFAFSNMATGRLAEYFNDHDTADVKVVIEVVQNDENLARRQLQMQGTDCGTANTDLRAHAIILICNSPVWKAQLARWQNTGEPKRITLMVEKGEEAAAHKLVQWLYTACLPEIETEVDLRMILGILMLADQYEVEAILPLCAQKLEMLTDLGLFSWDLADSVMQLPAGYLEKPGLSHLPVKIQEKILQHAAAEPSLPGIGLDLEVVMSNPTLEKGLMALPLRKCASLLSDDRCRVANENTVAAVVMLRLDRERAKAGESGELHAQMMCDVIRVPHLSSFFAAALPTFASQRTSVARPEAHVLGRELDRVIALQNKPTEDTGVGCIPECWLSGRRPPSTITALEFNWAMSTAALADKFDGGRNVLAGSGKHFFGGMDWAVYLCANHVPDNEGCTVGVYLRGEYPLLKEGPHYGATMGVSILAPDGESSLHAEEDFITTDGMGWGWHNFFDIPPMQKWDQSRMQEWTNSDGCLTLRVKISDVM